jgi:hypothetical protein
MSDTVDDVLNTVSEATEPSDVVVEETPVVSASETEAAEPVVEEEPEPAVEEPEPVDEEPEPVASASTTEAAEPAPSAPAPSEPAPSEPVSTQEVVQNVQGILSSTETNVTVDNSELEERVKFLEERLEKLIEGLSITGLIKDL